jgi:hypothetical protein
MTESDAIRLVKQVVREALAPILLGTVVSNQSQTTTTMQRFSSEPPVGKLRNVQPYGLSSRAPAGTPGLIIPVDANATNLILAGTYDPSKPTTEDGESILYDAYGHVIYMSQEQVSLGSKTASQNLVLGQIFKTFCDNLLGQLQTAMTDLATAMADISTLTVTCSAPGFPSSPPINAAAFVALQAQFEAIEAQLTALQSSPIDDESILSDVVYTE